MEQSFTFQVNMQVYNKDDIERSTEQRIRASLKSVFYLTDWCDKHATTLFQEKLSKEDNEFRFAQCKSGHIRLDPLEWLFVHAKLRPIPRYSAAPVANHPYVTVRLQQIEYMKQNDYQSYFMLLEATTVFIETEGFNRD